TMDQAFEERSEMQSYSGVGPIDGLTNIENNALDEVTLVSYVQKHPRDHELYKDWVMLGRSNGLMYIEPRFKEPLIERLQQAKPFQPNTDKRLLSKTNIGFATLVVIDILEELGCDTIRHVTYGKKLPIRQLERRAASRRIPSAADNEVSFTSYQQLSFNLAQAPVEHTDWNLWQGSKEEETVDLVINSGATVMLHVWHDSVLSDAAKQPEYGLTTSFSSLNLTSEAPTIPISAARGRVLGAVPLSQPIPVPIPIAPPQAAGRRPAPPPQWYAQTLSSISSPAGTAGRPSCPTRSMGIPSFAAAPSRPLPHASQQSRHGPAGSSSTSAPNANPTHPRFTHYERAQGLFDETQWEPSKHLENTPKRFRSLSPQVIPPLHHAPVNRSSAPPHLATAPTPVSQSTRAVVEKTKVVEKANEVKKAKETLVREWFAEQPGMKENPLLDLEGLDPAQDSAVEILHTFLLGIVKYMWHLVYKSWTPSQTATNSPIFIARLDAVDLDGTGDFSVAGQYM
ncbi:hypothetical protein B9479_006032, partial [Cryptococcus floricola]